MTEIAGLVELLQKGGPWAIVVLLALVIRWQEKRYDAIQEKRVSEGVSNGATARSCADALLKVHSVAVAADAQMAATNLRLKKYLKSDTEVG